MTSPTMHNYYAHIEGKAVTFNELPSELSHHTNPILKGEKPPEGHVTPSHTNVFAFFSAPGHLMLLLKEKEHYLPHISSFERVTV